MIIIYTCGIKKNKNSKESIKIQQIHLEDNMYYICKINDILKIQS